MNILWEELTAGLTNHDQLLRVFIRLFAAILLGGLSFAIACPLLNFLFLTND